ncbi:FecR domain-containing protein [Sandaracinobacter sp. RS1-74]|uniref:FecR family protein n=1 Tax=Sandaracinobacteroides sayramensis TaxID=2913411 RepID=UPI001EDC4E20|nr:FecR domain-containing protein [Sandaracinobacteroides sayramensis]MCG2839432.1 FecR domain-containing protein [Sandaracinobacteroides sayramensis]
MKLEDNSLSNWTDADVTARAWLVRLKSGEATVGELDDLASWRARDAENEQSFRRALHLWENLGPALGADTAQPMVARQSGLSRRALLGGGAGLAAASVAVLLVGGNSSPANARVYETRKGERQALRLGDRIGVELNTDSRISYWADAVQPRVELDRGEVVVNADCRDGQLLLTHAGNVEVQARKARFLLRLDKTGARISCLDGELRVRSGEATHHLRTGSRLDFRKGVETPEPQQVQASELAWQRDLLVFKDRPAGEVVAELNRYRPGHVYLTGRQAEVPISGVIHLDRADLAVEHIARSLDMKVSRLPGGIAVLRG